MKRLWLVLLSLALVMVFSASAFAVDVKFSGEYYAAGMYQDKVGLNKSGYRYYVPDFTSFPPGVSTPTYPVERRVQLSIFRGCACKPILSFLRA